MEPFSSNFQPGQPLWFEAIGKYVRDSVDADSLAEYSEDEQRWHLGASIIGQPCARKIWYSFRWVKREIHDGRMMRLFQRGHREEDLFVHRLRRIGITVWDRDPNSTPDPVTGELKQWRIVHPQNAHYGGSLDGIAFIPWLPEGYQYVITEFKTHSENSFKKISTKGIAYAKPEHYGQMSTYGQKKGYHYGLYCAVNKNNDDWYPQYVPLKHAMADGLDSRAIKIIEAERPPTKYSENSAHHACKNCNFRGPCHLGEPYEKSCRSCHYVRPLPDGTWFCTGYNVVLEKEYIKVGCASWAAAL